ncbi:sialidase family protein [Maribellus maritimus]|uniref:sialidase family protein n=1 Tax=Maribellus maritimus TaxID=2870838 RepID=UPI001EEC9FD6|nr:sialidase family protein [Maribellus maritimus]MCG6188461.1 glycoside hydrolase [Maribellus maritimus]
MDRNQLFTALYDVWLRLFECDKESVSERKINQQNMLKRLSILLICIAFFFISAGQENKSFFHPPQIIKKSEFKKNQLPENRKFSGISSLAVSPGGRIWCIWYAGITPKEDSNNYVVLASSEDQGNTWEEVLVIDPDGDGPVRAFDPEVWIDPNGMLWVFWAQAIEHDGTVAGVWSLTATEPDSKDPQWSEPRRLTDGVMMCKPLVLSSGEWLLPASTWRLTDYSAKAVVSADEGKTWTQRGAVDVPKQFRNYDEHMIIEKYNGDLWMLVRTKYGIGKSISSDRGKNWTPLIPSKIQHPAARFFIRRLSSGNLLLVKHGPIDMRTGRSHLMAFISKDDGFSWSNGLLLDERPGVSYPDGQQTSDGTIYITYDYNRTKEQNVLFTSFTEDDVLTGTDRQILNVFKNRKIVSNGGGRKD